MTHYITNDNLPGILYVKGDDGTFLAANQPAMLEHIDRNLDLDHLHHFAAQPGDCGSGTVELVITCGAGRNDAAVWMGVDAAQELVDALKIAIASARWAGEMEPPAPDTQSPV